MRSRLALALGVAAILSAPASAQQAGSVETARALVETLKIERTLDPLFTRLMPLMVGNVEGAMRAAPDTPATLKARLATPAGRDEVGRIISEEFGAAFRARYPEIKAAAAEEYRRTFSEPELSAILAFYRSPTGTKLIEVQPQLQKTLSEAGQGVGREAAGVALPKIQARLEALEATPAK